jgi:hypothetical protein
MTKTRERKSPPNYWDGNAKYQEQFERLEHDLVPESGSCSTVAGELIRAAGRLNWDFYNNGMGNNTSGAINFLKHHGVVNSKTFSTIHKYSRGELYEGNFGADRLHNAIIRMTDRTVEFIIDSPDLESLDNTANLFDFQEEAECYG